MPELHPQDWLLVVEALATYVGHPDEPLTPRRRRAWHLIGAIAAEQGLDAAECLRQIDPGWRGVGGGSRGHL